MRRVHVQVAAGEGGEVLRIAAAHGALVTHAYRASSADERPLDVAVVHIPNHAVGRFVDALGDVAHLHVAWMPQGVIALTPPASEVPQDVQDVGTRSPIEIFLGGLQSVGSWWSFLSYAALAGGVVWLGLLTNTAYLLVAAMLIAPFAGPAMNTAIATARGDGTLLGRAVARYVSGLTVTSTVAAVLTWVFQQEAVTAQMAATANISTAAVVLPLVAGAAGALHLVQGERSNLVSGASIGTLVAASLAPPAGLLGMAVALADWELVPSAGFLLGLQLVGINLSGAAVFRAAGLTSAGRRYPHGRSAVAVMSSLASAAALAALLVWQFGSAAPTLQRSTLEQRARSVVQEALREEPEVRAAAVEARFTRPNIPGQHTLLLQVFVQYRPGVTGDDVEEALGRRIRERVQAAIGQHWRDVTPLVDVTVLTPP